MSFFLSNNENNILFRNILQKKNLLENTIDRNFPGKYLNDNAIMKIRYKSLKRLLWFDIVM